ncbi:hypothetical protein CBM2615_B10218 [Cupriavidus taiwanensis]|uniref:Uncharacterized protein n=1 Tax=Cupriavidus taiwanensis TaxID=164546 RepID=A0A976AZD4_9BURK|nr:hypothetical protein CBM2615_B10218 [Cupriavidus taiwanensis]SOZ66316.1 hypothetical protein CBM2613_B10218 [Cupriavidus taiwanensis]
MNEGTGMGWWPGPRTGRRAAPATSQDIPRAPAPAAVPFLSAPGVCPTPQQVPGGAAGIGGECGTSHRAPARAGGQRLSLHSDFSYDAAQYTGR